MRWLFALALLCHLLTPAPSWAQTTTVYNANGERSVGTAMANTLDASMTRRGLTQSEKDSTFTTIRKYMALPIFNQNSWIVIGKALGLPVGTNLVGGVEDQFCQLQPTHSTCTGFKGSDFGGGAGAGMGWENPAMCDMLNYNLDFAGNLILPAMDLPNPKRYIRGAELYYGGGTPNFNTWSPLTSIKVFLHQYNGLQTAQKKLAPMYVAADLPNFKIFSSAPAYYEGTSLKAATTTFNGSVRNPNAWSGLAGYGTPPPPDYVCEGGIGLGDNNQHWLTCLDPPSGWDIPSQGVIPASNLNAWGTGAPYSNCKFSKEFIRAVADAAYKQACTAYPADCPKPYQRVEPEDVKTGGKDPTIREASTTTDKTLPTNSTPTNPTTPSTEPTATPSTGPDWTNPNTAAPNPTAPTAQSIVDKAFDWGFPAITINIPSGTCPTYSADFFGHQLVLDSHCPFIETNRALISAMMLLLFTIAAGIIVLRA